MTWVGWWLLLSTLAAFLTSGGFLGRLLMTRWEETSAGRMTVVFAAAVWLPSAGALLRRFGATEHVVQPILALAWTVLSAATVWRWRVFERVQRDA